MLLNNNNTAVAPFIAFASCTTLTVNKTLCLTDLLLNLDMIEAIGLQVSWGTSFVYSNHL